MPYWNLTALQNQSTMYGAAQAMVSAYPSFIGYVLFFEFIVIMLTGTYAQSRRIGFSNIFMWGSIAGLITTTSAFTLSAIIGIIDYYTIGICIAVTMLCIIVFFMTDLE